MPKSSSDEGAAKLAANPPLILVVEDDAESRMLVRDVLDFHRYEVLEAQSAEAGLALARRYRPALILMDVRLPGIDGYDALAALRSDPTTKTIPVMAVTASAMSEDRRRIAEAGFDAYHGKPIDIARLVSEIDAMLARRGSASGR
jgi:CheY-like chemotaxis protein